MKPSWTPPEDMGHRVVEFPDRPNVWIGAQSIEEIRRRYAAGNVYACSWADESLANAEKWSAKPDAWYLDTIWHREPRGIYTCACPIHPFRVRYYSYFDWTLDDPWRLHCPYCRSDGREYAYYPNPRYPDDGDGCFPTDRVWREDHDEAWSEAHDGIPWDHWDGEAHGYVEPTNAFYFKALCWMNSLRALSGHVLHRLGEASHAARLKSDPETASRHARKARVLLVTLARAFLGDAYLAALLETSETNLRKRLAGFYEHGTPAKSYPGYRLYAPFDHIEGDPERPLNAPGDRYGTKGASIYPGVWNWKASLAQDLLFGYSLIAESFEEAESDLKAAALRVLTSVEGDTLKLGALGRKLKRGILEYTLHPYALVTGADNLSSSTQMPRLQLGRIVGDDRIVENVARDILYFLHNFFTGDGLGKEGSPSYTSWGISGVMEAIHGQRGAFDRTAPYYDVKRNGINMLSLPVFKHGLGQYLKTGFPDGRPIAWEDCVIRAAMPLEQLALAETRGGGIPDDYRDYLNIDPDGDPVVSLKLPMRLPSHLLGQNRKAILRSGEGDRARTLSLDYTERVGHYHMAPLNLTLYAVGHELATDLGYMGSTHFMTVDWIKTFPAHNSVAIRTRNGDPMGTDNLRGDLRFFVDLPGFKAIDAAEEDADELAKVPGADRYQRTVALIDCGDEEAYVVDVFRVSGGHVHDWTFHCNGHRFSTEGVDLRDRPDPTESLYNYSGFTFTPSRRTPRAGALWGAQRVAQLSTGRSNGPWTATWGDVAEYPDPKGAPEIDTDAFLKLHMLDTPGSEIIAGTGPAQRWLDNRDLGEQMKLVTVRRRNRHQPNAFLAVHEPYRKTPFIERASPRACKNGEAAGLQVTHHRGTDLILSNTSGAPGEISHSGRELRSDGELAFASFDAKGLRTLALVGGTFAESGGRRVEPGLTLEGILTGFDDVGKSLTIQPDAAIADPGEISEKTITFRHRERASAYTIQSCVRDPEGTYTLQLAGFPHLAVGYLLVTAVENDLAWVEPPPVIQGKEDNLNIFKVRPDRSLAYLQPLDDPVPADILDERGTRIRTRFALRLHAAQHLCAGDEVAFSALHPGVDRFRIFGSGQWHRRATARDSGQDAGERSAS